MSFRQLNLLAALVALVAVFTLAPLEYPGAFQSHTGLSAVYNLIQLDENPLQSFDWAPTFGATYDILRTDGVLPYWLALVPRRVGFGYLDSIKLVYALAWLVSGLGMFALAKRFYSDAGAMLAAVVYVYLPFHIATVYVRGAFAEAVAWAVFPFALLILLKCESSITNLKGIALCAFPFTLLYLVQSGIAILFSLFAIGIGLALKWRASPIKSILLGPLTGLVVGALLSVPVLIRYALHIGAHGFTRDWLYPYQLFSAGWGFALSPVTEQASQGTTILDQFPFQLGIVPLALAIVAVALYRRADKSATSHSHQRVLTIFLAASIATVLLTFQVSAPLWIVLGFFADSPWQVLTFTGLALAIVAGLVVESDARFSQPPMLAFFVSAAVIASYGYLFPRYVDFAPKRAHIGVYGKNEIALLDYRIVGPLRRGATVRVELKWQALRRIDRDYTVFLHAVNADGQIYAQSDARPQGGKLSTLEWLPGQIVFDTHTIQIDVEGPREGYQLHFGLYHAPSNERALLQNGADVLILPRPGDPPPTISDNLPSP